jgi:hypothetical protein
VEAHCETAPLKRGGTFRRWLRHRFFQATEGAPSAQAEQEAINVLEARAFYRGTQIPVYHRVAERDSSVYLDLANADGQIVKVTAAGWEVLDSSPVKFVRGKGMLPLPVPVRGGTLKELRPFVNVPSDCAWQLIVAWLMATVQAKGPYPLLALNGEQGSAKSTTTHILREMIDPHELALRVQPESVKDLMVAAKGSHILAFENCSRIPNWLSDSLCILATGGGMGTRQLFTDDEEVIFKAMRPVVMNGIGDLVVRPDLIDRTLFVNLPPILDAQRKTEKEVWSAFRQAHPRLLGALLDGISLGLRRLPTIVIKEPPRMADFAHWATATEGAAGVTTPFLASYNANRSEANALALEFSAVGQAVLQLVEAEGNWSGTATVLLSYLRRYAPEDAPHRRDWPGSPRGLSGTLKRLVTNLRVEGVEVNFHRGTDRKAERLIDLARRR